MKERAGNDIFRFAADDVETALTEHVPDDGSYAKPMLSRPSSILRLSDILILIKVYVMVILHTLVHT